ncbi:MAG: hypothetical protein HC883_00120 [Bdellovibrionaceae bacterium]|nr:hypothetical protein [Pseudobdellovibrionaceae bacterium]
MGEMFQAGQERRQTKKAFADNTVTGEDGMPTLDRKRTMADLMRVNPEAGMRFGEETKALEASDARARRERAALEADAIARVAGEIRDQATYDRGLKVLAQQGIDTSKLPPQYDPQLVNGYRMRALSVAEQFAQQNKQRELDLKEQEIGIKRRAGGAGGGVATPGLVPQAGARPTVDDAKKAKEALVQKDNILDSLTKLEGLVKEHGTESFSMGNASSNMAQLATDARMGAKDLYQLGVLTGPDMDLLSSVIPDPSDAKWAVTWNSQEKVANQLARAKEIIQNKAENVLSNRGYAVAPKKETVTGGPTRTFKTNDIEWK